MSPNQPPRPISVVVVDDAEDVRMLLELQLSMLPGLRVVGTAANGAEALSVCADAHPDAVVLDLLMPGVNGFEAIASLRKADPSMAIVAYTGSAGDFARDEMSRLGVPVVLKAGDPTVLVSTVRDEVRRLRGASA